MNPWKVILSTLVIFGAGVVTGGLLVNHILSTPARPKPPVMQALNPWQARNRDLLRRMDKELGLTTDQHARIEKIIIDSQERTKLLWRPIVPEMTREMQDVHARIRGELNPAQQTEFDALLKPRQSKRNEDGSASEHRRRASPTNSVDSTEARTNAPPEAP